MDNFKDTKDKFWALSHLARIGVITMLMIGGTVAAGIGEIVLGTLYLLLSLSIMIVGVGGIVFGLYLILASIVGFILTGFMWIVGKLCKKKSTKKS